MANAPNNPSTSYHPIAVTKATTVGTYTFDHLIINGAPVQNIGYNVTRTDNQVDVTVKSEKSQYKVTLIKNNNVVNETKMTIIENTSQNVSCYGYSTTELSHGNVVLSSGKIDVYLFLT